jgi:hypothetical protein
MEACHRDCGRLRRYCGAVRSRPPDSLEDRWTVAQDETVGLGLTAFVPEDVEPDGTMGGSVLASFAYPDDPERHTHARALGAASHMAALDRRPRRGWRPG